MDSGNSKDVYAPVRHSDWKALAVWALIGLLSLATFYTQKQFDGLDRRTAGLEVAIQQLLTTNEKRLTRLETGQEILLSQPPCTR
jgi:hypothetical protein